MVGRLARWFDRTVLELGREFQWSYLPPLMVYLAAGVSGLTGIVGTFFVMEYLSLSAEFLAALSFWVGIPWALKMPLGHLVDLIWRFKFIMVYIGAGLIALSLLIMVGLLGYTDFMSSIMPVEAWFVMSALLAPIGYVVQDVVADAMTVEAVPLVDKDGHPIDPATKRLMHTTMQTLGRVAIIGGGVLVSMLNVYMFNDVANMDEETKIATYIGIYEMALVIPIISVAGVVFSGWLKWRKYQSLRTNGMNHVDAWGVVHGQVEKTRPNWWILGGSLVFVVFTVALGFSDLEYNQEIIFIGSFAIVGFLMWKLLQVLDEDARRILLGTAIIIFIYRALPGPGPGSSWWMIDELKFDQQFFSVLSLISATLTLVGMFIFRRFMAEKSIAYIIVFLTIASTVLSLPIIGMFYGLHNWTAALTGGVVDARFIALVDTALESPLGQIAMIPMLAWIANSAPSHLKATFFAVMASFTNLALSASSLGTKYLNQIYTVNREVKDRTTGEIQTTADYGELGMLLITVTTLGVLLPLAAIWIVKRTPLKSA